jgi:hypothetical protein
MGVFSVFFSEWGGAVSTFWPKHPHRHTPWTVLRQVETVTDFSKTATGFLRPLSGLFAFALVHSVPALSMSSASSSSSYDPAQLLMCATYPYDKCRRCSNPSRIHMKCKRCDKVICESCWFILGGCAVCPKVPKPEPPKLPFQSLTSANPLCSLPNGGMFGHQEAILNQASNIRSTIECGRLDGVCGGLHTAWTRSANALFAENHNILANLGYGVETAKDKDAFVGICISWKCPGKEICRKSKATEESSLPTLAPAGSSASLGGSVPARP